jgi:hypothetical protein
MTSPLTQVNPATIRSLARHMMLVTAYDVDAVAKGVDSFNGVNVDAFGVCFAQILGVQSRFAMAAAADHLVGLTELIDDIASCLNNAANVFEQTDFDNAVQLDVEAWTG